MSYPFAIHVHEAEHGVKVIRILEALDPEAAPRLAQTLKVLLEESPRLVLDMSRCDYICSTGVSTLYYYTTEAAKKPGGNLVLAFVPGFVANVLHNTVGPDMVPMFPTVNDALTHFGESD